MFDIGNCLRGKTTRGYEHAFPRTFAVKGSNKSLDFWSADTPVPFLRLKVHNIEPKTILADYTVNALVSAPTDSLAGVLT